ncbi:hypothetical protein TPHA_0N01020 [Tetrapisispora phaffii CBS 4417]|uniref:Low temperature viability protein n=1 Tax=Tetrapisispora phaffii (strain ATCC 24235 / CBS 4417 / NBRC 1672 / NRRL Y-8282 / UCD 70-5) TaxID=1071381 RepID=G8C155_TETPH|nr:hypothetical protein TPHA_0N01020 [Tetrapisispora phaffii CBS 4417]CCE65883.1 hypothetical protein TPHA_0N01020 [Tetrapisispora phaffii CBS 4417]
MSKKFDKKSSQRYVVVHRPHDDPHFYDEDASKHILVPVTNPNERHGKGKGVDVSALPSLMGASKKKPSVDLANDHVGEAALYGITFDDSKYDYTQHLKPIGLDPANSVFIPSKDEAKEVPKKNIEDLFVEPSYRSTSDVAPVAVFQRGVATQEYLKHQEDAANEISGFRPDLDPSLREILEALDDEAYVVNEDVDVTEAIKKKGADAKKLEQQLAVEQDDDFFSELLAGGEAEDEEDVANEWDIDAEMNAYEDEHYQAELAQFDDINNLEDLQEMHYQADVMRFQKDRKHNEDLSGDELSQDDLESVDPQDEVEEEDGDFVGALPDFSKTKKVSGSKKRKDRHKKGAMSDISGFSMSSSAIARTEVMTVLDDHYDTIITGYDNYEEEQELDEEETTQPFDMEAERGDFESMLDDFLDNYELDNSGRKLVKKSAERDRLKEAADEVSKGKLSMRRKREQKKNQNQKPNGLAGLSNSLNGLHL